MRGTYEQFTQRVMKTRAGKIRTSIRWRAAGVFLAQQARTWEW